MQAAILVSGLGKRMGTLTERCPKPMLSLLGKPLLEWKLEMLPHAIDEVVFVVGYLGDRIEAHFGQEWQGRRIRYVHQTILNGTGGAMLLLKDVLADRFLIMMGDDLYHQADLAELTEKKMTVLGVEVSEAEQYGLLETTPEGNLLRITERPHGRKEGVVNAGAYVLDRRYFDYPPVKFCETEYGLPQTLALLAQDIPVAVSRAQAWQPIGVPEDLLKGESFLKKYWVK